MIQRSHFISLTLVSLTLILQGCSSVKKTLGIERDPPNEYAVTPSVQPLEMPPDFFCLPEPKPGMERPQDKVARDNQEEKFLGSTRKKESLSSGQKALLNMSGAQPNQEQIRSKVDTEARMEGGKDKPIIEKLGIKPSKPKGDAVNPYEEALELQKQGVPQNPSALQQLMPPPAARHSQQKAEQSLSLNPPNPRRVPQENPNAADPIP